MGNGDIMKKVLDGLYGFLKLVLTILMGLLIIPVTMQIMSRYFDFIPRYIWTEEMARFCFIWIILVGAMVAMREDEHFTVDVMPTFASDRANAISYLFVDFATFVMASIFVIWGWPLVQFGLLQTSEMAELPMVLIYMAWPITGIVWLLFLTERVSDHIKLFRSKA